MINRTFLDLFLKDTFIYIYTYIYIYILRDRERDSQTERERQIFSLSVYSEANSFLRYLFLNRKHLSDDIHE